MDRRTETPDVAALLAELDQLRRELANTGDMARAPGDSVRLVARLIPSLNGTEGQHLLETLREQGWFTLELGPEYTALQTLCSLADSLPGETCYLTRAFRPDLFALQMREEMSRALRHNADLALIVFAGATPLDEHGLVTLAEAARHEMGGGETLARLDAEHLAIIAPGARQLKARALAERILDHFAASLQLATAGPPACTAARAGIACFSPDGTVADPVKMTEKLREQAFSALESAPPNQARLFQRDTRPMSEKSVLVQAGEKQFLFFGSMEQS